MDVEGDFLPDVLPLYHLSLSVFLIFFPPVVFMCPVFPELSALVSILCVLSLFV